MAKYRVIKSKDDKGYKWYHAEKWRWWFPFWVKLSPKYNVKSYAKEFIPTY